MADRILVFWAVNQSVCQAMETNQFTIGAGSATENNLWGPAYLALNNAWMHDLTDPATGTTSTVAADTSSDATAFAAGGAHAGDKDWLRGQIDAIIQNAGLLGNFAGWCTDLTQQLLGLVGASYDKDQDSSLQQSAVTQESSGIQAEQSKETSTHQSELQALSSLQSNNAQAISPLSTAGQSVTDVLSSSASNQAGISA